MNLEKITSQVIDVVLQAGEFIRSESLKFQTNDIEEKGFNNLVTYVDKQTEHYIVENLAKIVPQAGFITEEETTDKFSATLNWIIDPLDGTTNFVRGFPFFASTVALADGHDLLLGVTYEVCRKELFHAWKGGGAYCNGERMKVTAVTDLKKSLTVAGFPYDLKGKSEDYFSMLEKLNGQSLGFRGCGSAAVNLAYVAAGRADAYFEFNLHLWDIAAGIILVREAGGNVTDFTGGTNYWDGSEVLAAGAVYPEIHGFLKKYFLKR